MLFLAWTQDSYFLAGWVGVTGAVALSLHLTAALFAVVAASGEQRGVTWANAGALCLFPIGLFALNPVSIGIAMALSRNVRRIHMQKLLWPIRNKNAKSAT
jgi:hypothetical protein